MILDINSVDGEMGKYAYYNFLFKTHRITLYDLCFCIDSQIEFFGEKQVHNLNKKTLVKLSKLLGGELDQIY